MRLGVDFGTTHTVVAIVDRGNYPVVAFEGGDPVPVARRRPAVRRSCASASTPWPSGTIRASASSARSRGSWPTPAPGRRSRSAGAPVASPRPPHRLPLAAARTTSSPARMPPSRRARRSRSRFGPGERLERAALPDAGGVPARRASRVRGPAQRAVGGRLRVRPPFPLHDHVAARARPRLRPRRRHVRRLAPADDGAAERGRHQRGVQPARRRRLRRGDPRGRPGACRGGGAGRRERDLLLEECARQKEAVGPNTRRLVRRPVGSSDLPPIALPIEDVYEACGAPRRPDDRGDRSGPGERREAWNGSWPGSTSSAARSLPARRPAAARALRGEAGEALASPLRRDGHRSGASSSTGTPAISLADRLTRHFGVLREAEAGDERRLRPDLSQGPSLSRRRASRRSRRPALPRRAQHRPLPLRGVQPPGRRAPRRRRHPLAGPEIRLPVVAPGAAARRGRRDAARPHRGRRWRRSTPAPTAGPWR